MTPIIRSRYEEYMICRERGHAPATTVLTSIPPWFVCPRCGTHYREQTTTVEQNVPSPPGEGVAEPPPADPCLVSLKDMFSGTFSRSEKAWKKARDCPLGCGRLCAKRA